MQWLKRRERRYAAGEVVVHEGEETDKLHVVASGWLHGSMQLKQGGRQILRFFFVGDITTTFSIAWGYSTATRSRLRLVDGLTDASFELPLTQQDLGDAVGLTKAHVNRSLKALAATGLLERDGKIIRITDVDALSKLVDFHDRHAHVVIDWLPPTANRNDLSHRVQLTT